LNAAPLPEAGNVRALPTDKSHVEARVGLVPASVFKAGS
jgi:hypothetical protein